MSDTRSVETKIMYYNGNDDVPTLIRLPIEPDKVTLGDFKAAINLKSTCKHKFFFKNTVEDVGIVKEEIMDNNANLPVFKGNIICYIKSQVINEDDDDEDDEDSPCSDIDQRMGGCGGRHSHRPHYHHRCDDFSDDDSSSKVSTYTNVTSVSSFDPFHAQRMKHRMPPRSETTSVSSFTDSSVSLDVIEVTLDLSEQRLLGMSLVGQTNEEQSGGIYVGSLMKGGAAALDGRIQPGDMILQVNDLDLSSMTNDQAVEILREAVHKMGRVKLVVAKSFDSNPENYFTIPREEPIQGINLEAWVHSTVAATGLNEYPLRPPSVSTLTSTNSSLISSYAESESRNLIPGETKLSINTEMETIVKVMARPDSGLKVKTRKWLKIEIPNAFIGGDLVDWLRTNVQGFTSRKEAHKYAKQMLKTGFIRPTINKKFSDHSYYVL